ncbi:uncharacterized protein LOC131317581 [Rhododendron vialii]|uniref:uncharacterized protein LOC131317581 n=1 Tax=Rhododendron vialii TaxID=182163 RepID=UPI00265FFD2E|nr:uncharacterized protein LOC131317581 [Rhododendron vialii]
MGNWAELPEDLLVLTAKKITLFKDFLSFSGVCRSWRSVAINDNFKGSEQIPWLMLSDRDKPDERQFVSLRKGSVIRTVNLPEARGKRCLETLGWLVTLAEDGEMNLLHPFTRVQIKLPHVTTFKDYHTKSFFKNTSFIRKAVLSSRPEESKDYVLMVIHGNCGYLGFWRLGDTSWTKVEVGIVSFLDIIFHDGLFYGVMCDFVFAFDVWGPDPTRPWIVLHVPDRRKIGSNEQSFLVESAGVLLLGMRDYRNSRFQVYIPGCSKRKREMGGDNELRQQCSILGQSYDIPWHIVFITALWQIWKDRNKKSFDNIEIPICISARNIMVYSREIVEAFKSPLIMGSQQACLISWVNPIASNIKLNTDGCWYEMNGRGGFGGLFRDHKGDWIMGFYGRRNFSSSLEAEIWSIYKGLKIILERKLKNVAIESDSLTAVNLIKEGNPSNHPQSVLINEAHFIMAKTNTPIEHTYRSANQCADHLARMGVEQTDELVLVMDMPISMREFFLRDSLNIRQQQQNKNMGNWAELPEDILVLIAKRITLFEDFLFFSGVCRSWHSVAVNDNFKGSEQIPWLMLSNEDKPDERRFVSVRKDSIIRTVNLPEARGKRCLETLGWLLTTSEDGDINLLHPFTRVQINLPHISTSEYYHPRRNKHLRFINKAVLSSRPEEGKDYVLMAIYAGGDTGRGFLAFWRSRDKSWITVNIIWFCDINFYNGLCYGVVGTKILAFDVLGPNPNVALVVGYGPSHECFEELQKPYVVESAGVVLIVNRIIRQVSPSTFSKDDPYIFETCGFTLFEVDSSEKGKWVEKTSLGNSALFLGGNASVSVDASRFQGIKANCIYYTDSFKRGGNYMGIYNMEDESLSPCYEGEPCSLICPPMWVNPSPH